MYVAVSFLIVVLLLGSALVASLMASRLRHTEADVFGRFYTARHRKLYRLLVVARTVAIVLSAAVAIAGMVGVSGALKLLRWVESVGG